VPDEVLVFLDREELLLSPMAALEIEYLAEIGRITVDSRTIIGFLGESIGLRLEERHLARAQLAARDVKWTRDPFDRIIVAHAETMRATLVTRDGTIREHCHLFPLDRGLTGFHRRVSRASPSGAGSGRRGIGT
jgi:PIN domain nuclease of toxin-antitoxin system